MKRREENHWLIFTDLTAGLLALFILAFVAMTTMKEKKAEALTRTEQEVVSCQEEMRRVAKERNALLSQSLRAPLEKGIIALENGNIQIQASFLFPRNGADLTSEGVNIIKSIGKGLQDVLDTGDAIMVSGFTDDTPTNSPTYTNWNLSTERAVNVVKTLINQGFPPERVFAAGFGENHPRVPNTSEKNRSLNRRVEIGVTPIRRSNLAEVAPE
ncbi:MAG: OmpA family protein [Hallerella porci]|uniref:Flagellar motor protein MotB n=1 Tax=Hallerella porci TaxID=1945871 RepID=A0ABX5LMA4_9BACT|nr:MULTISPECIES: OmpA family protein [Hallerella]MCI5599870.1 OmpA family protein [Hallerella sp.]MDY3922050.1 OmpA family protein [Hallerella porci]PWL03536.1 flagellar motor protein MotB [Hallerella porci]